MHAKRSEARRWALYVGLGFLALVLVLTAAWHWTPLHEYVQPLLIARKLHAIAKTPWMPLIVALIYIAASLVMFPNTVLCLGIIIALGPVMGGAYAYGGSLAAALT